MLSQDIKLGLEHIAEMQNHKSMENDEHDETDYNNDDNTVEKTDDGKDDETDNKVNIDRVREIPNLHQCFQGNDYELKEKKGDEGEAEIKKNDEKGDDDEYGIKENNFENDNVEKEGRRGEKWDTLRLAGSKP